MTSQPPSPDPFDDNPYVSPTDTGKGVPEGLATVRDAYNIVSDTVVGVNIRKSDNLFQLKVILVCVLIAVPLGAIVGTLLSDADTRWVLRWRQSRAGVCRSGRGCSAAAFTSWSTGPCGTGKGNTIDAVCEGAYTRHNPEATGASVLPLRPRMRAAEAG